MPGKLLYRDAQNRDASVDLVPDGTFLGRAADCAVRTDDAMVSRKNCKIAYTGGRWVVEDLGSSNGTFVNEVRIQKQALNHSDIIRCGTLQVRFVDVAETPAAKGRTVSAGGSVQVDPGLGGGGGGGLSDARLMAQKEQEVQALEAERDRLATRLRDTAQELELLHSKAENDSNELKKLRSEMVQLRDKSNDISRKASYRDDEMQAATRIAEELRHDLTEMQADHAELKKRFEEVNEECGARGRLLERATDDQQRFKTTAEELRNKLTELQRVKDEGWKELNNRVGEIEHLREVINEQERILEERRVALMTFESTIKEFRQEKDSFQRDALEMKRERDELREKVIKQNQHAEAIDEEHRRLVRAMSELEQGGGRGGGGDTARLSAELRDAKVELRKVEAESQRLATRLQQAEEERDRLADTHANLDVDRAGHEQEKRATEQKLQRAEDARARAEMARSKAEEEKAEAVRARDSALQNAASQRKRADELDDELRKSLSGDRSSRSSSDGDRARKLQSELDALRDELEKVKSAPRAAAAGGADVVQLKRRAEEAYYGINDALSELRTNILLAKDLVSEHGHKVPDASAVDTLNEAIQVSADRAEDAKGLLRSLLEVIES